MVAGIAGSAMVTFEGAELSDPVRDLLANAAVAGVSVNRHRNYRDPGQVRALVEALQEARPAGSLPLLVATDQEGGQLMALGEGFTPFAGNMALGAAGDAALAERVGAAIGRELRAVGVNVDYAPVCDLALTPENVSLGIRSFGDDPAAVARLVEATVRGLESAGVAATAKHFPGAGDITADPHHELPLLAHDRERLLAVEGEPFRAAFRAGASLVMMGHLSVPAVTGRPDLPASVSSAAIRELLRGDLGFDGVVLTDAMDMKALGQGPLQIVEAIAALRAGQDLLLLWDDAEPERRMLDVLERSDERGLFDPADRAASRERVNRLRARLAARDAPDLDVVGCAEHEALARELADRSITLVRDDDGLLPVRPDAGRVAVVTVRPADLTPADTSSTVAIGLADAIAARHAEVDGFETSHPPTPNEIADLRARAASYDLVVVGTLDAVRDPRQRALVAALLEAGPPVVWAALRTPWDLLAFPDAKTYVCSYGILRPSVEALADALWGRIPLRGRLPVGLGERWPRGHGLQ